MTAPIVVAGVVLWIGGGLLGVYWWAEPRGYHLREVVPDYLVGALWGPALAMTTWTDYYHLGGRCPNTCCSIKTTGAELRQLREREYLAQQEATVSALEIAAEQAMREALAAEPEKPTSGARPSAGETQ